MPEKMRTRADKLAARAKRKRELRSDKLSSTWGADGVRGRRSGLPLSSRPGGRMAGPRVARDETPYARTRQVSIALACDCPRRVQQMITRRPECGLCG